MENATADPYTLTAQNVCVTKLTNPTSQPTFREETRMNSRIALSLLAVLVLAIAPIPAIAQQMTFTVLQYSRATFKTERPLAWGGEHLFRRENIPYLQFHVEPSQTRKCEHDPIYAVQSDFSRPGFFPDYIGFEPFCIIDIEHMNKFSRKQLRRFYEVFVNRDTAFVLKVTFGDDSTMNFGFQHGS